MEEERMIQVLSTWERLPEETDKAFKAFEIYLNLGHKRTIAEACRIYRGNPSARRADGRFELWARDYNWRERSRDYDAYLSELALRRDEEAHVAAYEDFRRSQEGIAKEATDAVERYLKIANRSLQKYELDPEAIIPIKELPGVYKAISNLGELAGNAQALALGVTDLLRLMDRQKAT